MVPLAVSEILQSGGVFGWKLFARLIARPIEMALPHGTLVGPWRIERVLGRGGSSIVYLATRADGAYDQQVALKIVRADERSAARLRHERQVLAELVHHGIARLIDGGESGDACMWFAMELVDGDPIITFAQRQRLGWKDRMQLLDAVCEAVAFAHRRLVVHRDIKPSNVLIDQHGKARLMDFGIAAVEFAEPDEFREMTIQFASPEQLRGEPVGIESDIYQLGGLLELLLLPSGRSCATLPARLPRVVARELGAIVAKATAPDPGNRFGSVAEFQADLAATRSRQPVSVIPGTRYRLARLVERNRLASAIAATSLLLLVGSAVFAARNLRIERDQALAAAARSENLRELFVGLFSVLDSSTPRSETLTAGHMLRQGLKHLENEASVDPELHASFGAEIGHIYLGLGENERAREVLETALGRAMHNLPDGDLQRVRLTREVGAVAMRQTRLPEALTWLDRADAEAAAIPDPTQRSLEFARTNSIRGRVIWGQGAFPEAWTTQSAAVSALSSILGASHPETVEARIYLGLAAMETKRVPRAIELFNQAALDSSRQLGANHRNTILARAYLGYALLYNGEIDRAEPFFEDSVRRFERRLEGHSSTLLANVYIGLSELRTKQGRYDEAIDAAEAADRNYRGVLGDDSARRVHVFKSLAEANLAAGRPAEALVAYESAVGFARAHWGEKSALTAEALQNVADVARQLNDSGRAISALREAIAIRKDLVTDLELPRGRVRLAAALIDARRTADAREQLSLAAAEFAGLGPLSADDQASIQELESHLMVGQVREKQ